MNKIAFVSLCVIGSMAVLLVFAFAPPKKVPRVVSTVPLRPTITPNPQGTVRLLLGLAPSGKLWIKHISHSQVDIPSKCDSSVRPPFVTVVVRTAGKKVLYSCKKPAVLHGSSIPLVDSDNQIVAQPTKSDIPVSEIVVFLPNTPESHTLSVLDTSGKTVLVKRNYTRL